MVVVGSSMQPALSDRQMALVDARAYRDDPVRTGDVVLLRWRGEVYVKRVAAVGGERVALARVDGDLTLVPESGELAWMKRYAGRHPDRLRLASVRVPRGMVYVVGDNQTASIDSRHFGPVPAAAVIGRVVEPRDDVLRRQERWL
jgi:signal peptidase I